MCLKCEALPAEGERPRAFGSMVCLGELEVRSGDGVRLMLSLEP